MKKTSKVNSGGVKSGGVEELTHPLTQSPTLSLSQALTTQYQAVVAGVLLGISIGIELYSRFGRAA
jgi:hypothetical protein